MATDSFDDSDSTPLATHNSEWTSIDGSHVVSNMEINSNVVETDANWRTYGAYHASSTSDYSQIVFVAQTSANVLRNHAVRAGASQLGYSVSLQEISGSDFTKIALLKNGSFLAYLDTGLTVDSASNHTLAVEASGTTTVTITAWLDDVEVSSPYDDSSTPLSSGHPAFWANETPSAGLARYDDWTDTAVTGVTVTPTSSAGVAGISAPTVVLGSLSITPTPISAVANKAEPTAINGSISITPTPISAIGAIVNPTVAITDSFITPSAAVAVAGIANPTVILGSLAITPTPVSAIGVSLDPSVIYGAIVPSSADAVAGVSNPTVVLGSLAITPAAATAVASRYNPTVNDGSISTKELVVGARRRKR
jgi:hypothetical protein